MILATLQCLDSDQKEKGETGHVSWQILKTLHHHYIVKYLSQIMIRNRTGKVRFKSSAIQ